MNRRVAGMVVAGALFLASDAAVAQRSPPPKVGLLGIDTQMQARNYDGFRDALRSLGYVEGQDIEFVPRFAEGDFSRLPQLAKDLVALDVKVIVTAAPQPVRSAQQATATIPIVMIVHDPIGMGFARSLQRPGGNITGIAFQDSDLSTKRLDLLRQAVPRLSRVALLWNREGGGTSAVDAVSSAAKSLGLQLLPIEVHGPGEFASAVATAKAWGAQAVLQMASPVFTLNRKALLELLRSNAMPASCEMRRYVEEGCLMTYSADLGLQFRGLATYVDRILKGADPATLPIEQPREFDLVINLKTAEALGLTLPQALRVQATDVVQ